MKRHRLMSLAILSGAGQAAGARKRIVTGTELELNIDRILIALLVQLADVVGILGRASILSAESIGHIAVHVVVHRVHKVLAVAANDQRVLNRQFLGQLDGTSSGHQHGAIRSVWTRIERLAHIERIARAPIDTDAWKR